jgi:predicted DNA-binding protein (MmcQ/YjbR family)
VKAAELKATCLALAGAAEEFPFGEDVSVFKVGGKIFAIARLEDDPLAVSLKCEPELADQLRRDHEAIRPGYHLNKRHWNTVTVDGSVPDRMVREMIEDSYDLIVASLSRAQQAALAHDRR